ncbi:MAG: hypothetical protein ABIT83_05170 [Massilia sp.]
MHSIHPFKRAAAGALLAACVLGAGALPCAAAADAVDKKAEASEPGTLSRVVKSLFGNVDSIEWKVEGGKGEQSTVTCKKSSSKHCVVLVGAANAPTATTYIVPAGQAMLVRNPGREMSYCIATIDRQDWPKCLGTKANRLKDSSSGASVSAAASASVSAPSVGSSSTAATSAAGPTEPH